MQAVVRRCKMGACYICNTDCCLTNSLSQCFAHRTTQRHGCRNSAQAQPVRNAGDNRQQHCHALPQTQQAYTRSQCVRIGLRHAPCTRSHTPNETGPHCGLLGQNASVISVRAGNKRAWRMSQTSTPPWMPKTAGCGLACSVVVLAATKRKPHRHWQVPMPGNTGNALHCRPQRHVHVLLPQYTSFKGQRSGQCLGATIVCTPVHPGHVQQQNAPLPPPNP